MLKVARTLNTELEGGGSGAPGHSNRVFCVKYDPEDTNLLCSGGWDNNIMVWDIRQPNPIISIYGPYICGESIDLHDGYLLTGSHRNKKQLQLWDVSTGEVIEDISWDEGLPSEKPCLVYSAQFQKNTGDLIVASGAGAQEIKVFDGNQMFKPCAHIKNLSRACFTIDFSNSGDMFATGGGDGVIRVFNVINDV